MEKLLDELRALADELQAGSVKSEHGGVIFVGGAERACAKMLRHIIKKYEEVKE